MPEPIHPIITGPVRTTRPPVLPPIQLQGPVYGNNFDKNNPDIPGVSGNNSVGGDGVYGLSTSGRGVHGQSQTFQGVYGESDSQAGVVGESNTFDGVFGMSHSATTAGVSGHNDKGGMGGYFDAKVVINSDASVSGTLTVAGDILFPATAADCAEEFDVGCVAGADPGTVMVLNKNGALQPSAQPYDKKVAGVVSGAGPYRPAFVLDRSQKPSGRTPLALVGKVFCKVDAQYAAIEAGDLLTTSPTPGHAMKAKDQSLAFGAVIGKALAPLPGGRALVPILIALQ